MSGIDAAEVRVGLDGNLYTAPVGTAAPADVTAPWPAAWKDLGYLSEDGVTQTPSLDTNDVMVWQENDPVRKLVTARTLEYGFKLMQRNAETVALAFGGGTVTASGTAPNQTFTFTPASPDFLDERAFGLEVRDGSVIDRYYVARGLITDVGDITIVRTDAVGYDLTMTVLAAPGGASPWLLLSNDPAMDPAGTVMAELAEEMAPPEGEPAAATA